MQKACESIFSTYDLFLSSVLLSLNFELEAIDKGDSRKVEFCFRRSSEMDTAIQAYWAKQLSVEPQALFANLKMLKNRIYSN